jgi:hypothetical protein
VDFEDKILALLSTKHSPKSHILLWTLLPLPSRSTLQSALNNVQFMAGINVRLFGALQHHPNKMCSKITIVVTYAMNVSQRELAYQPQV